MNDYDFFDRVGEREAAAVLDKMWSSRIDKKKACGIHGTLFYGLKEKKKYYPTKKEDEMLANPA